MLIPLNLQEIFVWYFEQKGVDNPERFLNSAGVNVPLAGSQNSMSNAAGAGVGVNGVNIPLAGNQNSKPGVVAEGNGLSVGNQNTLSNGEAVVNRQNENIIPTGNNILQLLLSLLSNPKIRKLLQQFISNNSNKKDEFSELLKTLLDEEGKKNEI